MNNSAPMTMSYKERFIFGSCWPTLVGFILSFLYVAMIFYEEGFFGNPKFEHDDPREWFMLMFPIMIGGLVATISLGINGVLFLIVRPKQRKVAFLIGILTLPIAMFSGFELFKSF